MKVLVAPDGFGGTLTAPEAARAIARGWVRQVPDDEVTVLPMADGGPGFIDTLHAVLGSQLRITTVQGPQGEPTPVTVLHVDDIAYLESAQACGLQLLHAPDPWSSSTVGVGQAVVAAVDAGATTVVIGLGGSATHDAGAGLLAALGAEADVPLDAGPRGLQGIGSVDLEAVRARLDGIRLVAATDVDVPLLGLFGTTKTFGAQKGLDEAGIVEVDAVLDAFVVATCGSTPAERRVADAPGAGAGGGLGFALLVLGAEVRSGVELVGEAVGLQQACAAHDLVVSGEGTYDHTSRSGKVVHGVATCAAAAARPCIVLAGDVTVGSREMRAMGVESAYSLVDLLGGDRAREEPQAALADLAARTARTWSR
ncbi:glycerate kinase [Aeromicrobium sp. CTD01-1L150]|uniref:glycerate kinase family protein n=1 Tax=Aeromicrobium sp. CTD01-1L150 TaxID=3341830 RepID=UPI0035C17042